jgi:tRNA nucleotidyltransferase/poly(A) polymerase
LVCWVAFADEPLLQLKLATFARNRDKVKPLIDGNYLMKTFNLRPSPRVGDLLTMLRNARIDGKVETLEEEHQLVVELLGAEEGKVD